MGRITLVHAEYLGPALAMFLLGESIRFPSEAFSWWTCLTSGLYTSIFGLTAWLIFRRTVKSNFATFATFVLYLINLSNAGYFLFPCLKSFFLNFLSFYLSCDADGPV